MVRNSTAVRIVMIDMFEISYDNVTEHFYRLYTYLC